MPSLTKRYVDSLRVKPGEPDLVVFDGQIPGFGIRVKASGAKSWLIQYRNAHGQSRRYTLARYGVYAPVQAKKEAKLKLAAVAGGADPAADRRGARGAITVSQLCDEYLEAGKGRIKPSTLAMDRSRIERHVKPLLGNKTVASLKPSDIEKFLRDIIAGKSAPKATTSDKAKAKRAIGGVTKGGPGVASRTVGMLSTILQRAVRDGVIASNPARGIARPKDQTKKPPYSIDKIKEVGKAIREMRSEGENEVGLRALRFLITTGFRRMEALTLQWGMIDWKARTIKLPDTKSGKQLRPVGQTVLDDLAEFKPTNAKNADFVFPSASKAGHLIGLPKVWARVAKRAGIKGVSLHGLRHWFGNAATELNYSELIIGALLGHRPKGITGRYSGASDPALLAAADRISLRLCDAIDGIDEGAKVVHFRSA